MSVPPGWYKDPIDPTVQRWWDGGGWIGDPLPADATPPPGPPAPGAGGPAGPQVPAVPGMSGAAEAPPGPEISVQPERGPEDSGGTSGPAGPRPEDRPGPEVPPHGTGAERPDPSTTPPPARSRRATDPDTPSEGGTQAPPQPHGHTLATPGSRLLARLVDIALVFGLNVLVNGWFVYRLWQEMSSTFQEISRRVASGDTSTEALPALGDRFADLLLTIVVIATALWFAYEVPAVANTGQTPGKRLLRIQVVRLESADPLTFGRSFRRWNTLGFPTLLWYCLGIGLILQAIDVLFVPFDRPLHQALHDKSANTVVVAVPAGSGPPRTPDKEASDESADPS